MTPIALVLIVLILAASFVGALYIFHQTERERMANEFRLNSIERVLPNKMQAYERMALYLDRISPMNMVQREQMKVQTAFDLYPLLSNAVRQEFEHNVAMQIYFPTKTWVKIERARDEVQKCLTDEAKAIDKRASSIEYGMQVVDSAKNGCQFHIDRALEALRHDIGDAMVIPNL
ncbi:MAG: hypothetical protein IKR17_09925 [Bacteroidales bacterium]|nr:hypothetical protein [Bacteroidales bacterium]